MEKEISYKRIVLVLFTIGCMAVILFNILPLLYTTGNIRGPYCPNNLKQIGYALRMYYEDEGAFPEKYQAVYPDYLDNKDHFKCPKAKDSESDSYIYLQPSGIESAEKCIIMFDALGNHESYRNVLFADGRIEKMSEEEFNNTLDALLHDPDGRKLYTKQTLSAVNNGVTDKSEIPINNILKEIKTRKTWTIRDVKMDLNNPPVIVRATDENGNMILLHAWPGNWNDFNVPMLRIDSGELLYQISEKELKQLENLKEAK